MTYIPKFKPNYDAMCKKIEKENQDIQHKRLIRRYIKAKIREIIK